MKKMKNLISILICLNSVNSYSQDIDTNIDFTKSLTSKVTLTNQCNFDLLIQMDNLGNNLTLGNAFKIGDTTYIKLKKQNSFPLNFINNTSSLSAFRAAPLYCPYYTNTNNNPVSDNDIANNCIIRDRGPPKPTTSGVELTIDANGFTFNSSFVDGFTLPFFIRAKASSLQTNGQCVNINAGDLPVPPIIAKKENFSNLSSYTNSFKNICQETAKCDPKDSLKNRFSYIKPYYFANGLLQFTDVNEKPLAQDNTLNNFTPIFIDKEDFQKDNPNWKTSTYQQDDILPYATGCAAPGRRLKNTGIQNAPYTVDFYLSPRSDNDITDPYKNNSAPLKDKNNKSYLSGACSFSDDAANCDNTEFNFDSRNVMYDCPYGDVEFNEIKYYSEITKTLSAADTKTFQGKFLSRWDNVQIFKSQNPSLVPTNFNILKTPLGQLYDAFFNNNYQKILSVYTKYNQDNHLNYYPPFCNSDLSDCNNLFHAQTYDGKRLKPLPNDDGNPNVARVNLDDPSGSKITGCQLLKDAFPLISFLNSVSNKCAFFYSSDEVCRTGAIMQTNWVGDTIAKNTTNSYSFSYSDKAGTRHCSKNDTSQTLNGSGDADKIEVVYCGYLRKKITINSQFLRKN